MKTAYLGLAKAGTQPEPFRWLFPRLMSRTPFGPMLTIDRGPYSIRLHRANACVGAWDDPTNYRREETFLRSILRPGDTVVDVGANIGLVTLTASALVESGGRVVAIEPHPRTFSILQDHISLNAATNVVAVQSAVGESGGAAFISDGAYDDMNHIERDKTGGIAVPCLRLDDLASSLALETVRVLKIDVEGFELFVLRGGRATLARTSFVYIEVAEAHFAVNGYSTADVLAELAIAGFECRSLNREGLPADLIPAGWVANDCQNILAIRQRAAEPSP